MLRSIIGIAVAVTISWLIAIAGRNNSTLYDGMPIFLLCASVGFVLHWLGFIPAYLFQTEHYFDLIGSISYVATVALAFALAPSFSTRRSSACGQSGSAAFFLLESKKPAKTAASHR